MTTSKVQLTAGQRIGRFVGSVLTISSIGFVLALLFIPAGAGIAALVTWPKEVANACAKDYGCFVSTLPQNALPVWVAYVWIAIIAMGLIVCWKPSRWWIPDAQDRRKIRVRCFSSPGWIRIHAVIAAVISFYCATGVSHTSTFVPVPEYLGAVFAAGGVAVAASVCMHVYSRSMPDDIKHSLMLSLSAPVGVFSPRWRAAQNELHPRDKTKPEPHDD